METIHLTYKEIADRLGTQVDSVRKLVRRRRWAKLKGNDGELRVAVPVEYFASQDDAREPGRGVSREGDQELLLYVKELEAQIDGLKALIESEKQRADVEHLRASAAERDRDRWYELATRPWWRRLVG